MSNAKYNVLMMRDNSPVRRYRVSPAWLRAGIYLLLLLLAVAGGGGWAGFTFWTQNMRLSDDLASTQRELRDARIELERLRNIDNILKSNDPEDLQSLLGTVSQSEKAEEKPTAPPVDLRKLFRRVDMQQVRVDNLQAKVEGEHVNITFNLNNLIATGSITGSAELTLLTADGREVQPKVNRDDLVFQIQRFKQIATAFDLPEDTPIAKVFGVRLGIKNSSGQTLFSETYPLSYIRS
ncbi:hypothetical protein GGQ74_001714 [Desulfobaculum xiamenense]|uniref:Uncharacterized protein n=1 Tax=Desulfobaculum xiamenense TaxID=995050 RepID=A0A846QIP9_9BACT|nr:hypothetical protein [Desulfobaculum xiamenense]NJB68041.1 hypothetical protein [Desulfobaculum xiamenense]